MKVLTFGEIMLRLKAPGHERFFQSPMLEATFGGGEANVAISLANYGMDAEFLTVLPKNDIAECCIRELRYFGVDTKKIALSLELYTTGSLDIFGHTSTVSLDKRITVFDIRDLGAQLKPAGLLVITDTILNRVTLNWKKGKRTHVFIDEFHVVFENEHSGIFFNSAWRQFRKRNAYQTAITQNVEYLLDSVQASTMLSNSEFIIMLNQAASDRKKLAKLLNISSEQMSYVTNADAGCGLIKYGSALVPFENHFPHGTKLYQLMTTKPGEGVFGSSAS